MTTDFLRLSLSKAQRVLFKDTNARAWREPLRGTTSSPTYMVCRGGRYRSGTKTAQLSRHGFPHVFGLNARLQAVAEGYQVLGCDYPSAQSPNRLKSAAHACLSASRAPSHVGARVLTTSRLSCADDSANHFNYSFLTMLQKAS